MRNAVLASQREPAWVGYVVAVASVVALTVIFQLLHAHLSEANTRIPYVLLVGAIGYRFGGGPALLCVVLSVPFHLFYISFPHWSTHALPDWTSIVILAFAMLITSAAMVVIRRNKEASWALSLDTHLAIEQMTSMLSSITDGFFVIDRCWCFTYINPRAEHLLHRHSAECVGHDMRTVFPETGVGEVLYSEMRRAMDQQVSVNVEAFDASHQAWFEAHIHPSEEGLVVYLEDITARRQSEVQMREFYRRTILAATDGKLVVTESEEIMRMAGPAIGEWAIKRPDDIPAIREDVVHLAQQAGMNDRGIRSLVTCVGEAATNACKHAGGGMASLHRHHNSSLVFIVADHGPGIAAMSIPDVALLRGYSTAGTLGMGYKMMITMASRVYLATSSEGTIVACKVKLNAEGIGDPLFEGQADPQG
jgi:PAS domain-containing protein/anti-sigma regulatory factor (Ser/Thr protein kinase)